MEGGGEGDAGGEGGCGGGGEAIGSNVPQYAIEHVGGCGSRYVRVSVTPASYEHVHTCTCTLQEQAVEPAEKQTVPVAGASPIDGCGVLSQPG
jgi:hypothetical protein